MRDLSENLKEDQEELNQKNQDGFLNYFKNKFNINNKKGKVNTNKPHMKPRKVALIVIGVLTATNITLNTTTVKNYIENSNSEFLDKFTDLLNKIPVIGNTDELVEKIPGIGNIIAPPENYFPSIDIRPIDQITEDNVTPEDVGEYLDNLALLAIYSKAEKVKDDPNFNGYEEFSAEAQYLEACKETYKIADYEGYVVNKSPFFYCWDGYYYLFFAYNGARQDIVDEFEMHNLKVEKAVFENFMQSLGAEPYLLTEDKLKEMGLRYEDFYVSVDTMVYNSDITLTKEFFDNKTPEQLKAAIDLIINISQVNPDRFYNPYAYDYNNIQETNKD